LFVTVALGLISARIGINHVELSVSHWISLVKHSVVN